MSRFPQSADAHEVWMGLTDVSVPVLRVSDLSARSVSARGAVVGVSNRDPTWAAFWGVGIPIRRTLEGPPRPPAVHHVHVHPPGADSESAAAAGLSPHNIYVSSLTRLHGFARAQPYMLEQDNYYSDLLIRSREHMHRLVAS